MVEVHEKVVDLHGNKGSLALNVEGYRRQIARQAVCMFVAGASRGLQGVHLQQVLSLPLQNRSVTTLDIEVTRAVIQAVPRWNEATSRHDVRWNVFDAVFAASNVLHDRTDSREIKTFKLN